MYFRWPYSSGLSTSLPCYSRLSCWPTMSGERVSCCMVLVFHQFYFWRLVHSGTTTFESNRRIHSYNLGWRQNWREVMGYNWRMALVWPGAKWVKCHIIHECWQSFVLCQVKVASQWGGVGHPEHLETGGAQKQMRLRETSPIMTQVVNVLISIEISEAKLRPKH